MLVLSRKPGESILIGKDVEVVILAADGVNVRIGVRAPREVPVLRRELVAEVQAENRLAAASPSRAVLGRLSAGLGAAAARGDTPGSTGG